MDGPEGVEINKLAEFQFSNRTATRGPNLNRLHDIHCIPGQLRPFVKSPAPTAPPAGHYKSKNRILLIH